MGMYYKVKKKDDAQKVKCFRNCRCFQIWNPTFFFAILLKQNIKIFQPEFSPAITILDILWIIHRMIFSSLVFFHFLISFDFLIALNFLAKYSNFQLDFDQKSILIDVGKIYVVYVVFFLSPRTSSSSSWWLLRYARKYHISPDPRNIHSVPCVLCIN